MKLKINRYVFDDISNQDYVLYNGIIAQVITRKIYPTTQSYYMGGCSIKMNMKQFNSLIKDGILVVDDGKYADYNKENNLGCTIYRFNVDEQKGDFGK